MARTDPHGNELPRRMYWNHGAYWRVVKNKWTRLSDSYPGALKEWARLEGALENGQTVAHALEAYLVERGPELSPKTMGNYRSSERNINRVFGHMPLEDVERRDVRKWLHARSAHVAANRDLALLRAAFNYVKELGWIDENPASGVRRRTEHARDRVALPDELARLQAHATPMMRAIIAFAVMTGMDEGVILRLTRGQIIGLNRDEAQPGDGILYQRSKTAKRGRQTLIAWSPALREVVRAAYAAQDIDTVWVFPSRLRKPYTEDGFKSNWARLKGRAGCPGLQFRDLRRTAATNAATLEDARALLGHSTTAITGKVYRVVDNAKPSE